MLLEHLVGAELGATAARPPGEGQGNRVGALALDRYEGVQRLAQGAVDGDGLTQVIHEIAEAQT